ETATPRGGRFLLRAQAPAHEGRLPAIAAALSAGRRIAVSEQSGSYVRVLDELHGRDLPLVGGKGAHLGELSRIDGLRVPPGFCVTTHAYRRTVAEAPSLDEQLDALSRVKPGDRAAVVELSAEARRTIERVAVPDDVAAAIGARLGALGQHL